MYEAPESNLIILLPWEACEAGLKLRRGSETEHSSWSHQTLLSRCFLKPQELETIIKNKLRTNNMALVLKAKKTPEDMMQHLIR